MEIDCILWLVFEPGNKSYIFCYHLIFPAVCTFQKLGFRISVLHPALPCGTFRRFFMLNHGTGDHHTTRPVRRIVAFVLMLFLTVGAASSIVSAKAVYIVDDGNTRHHCREPAIRLPSAWWKKPALKCPPPIRSFPLPEKTAQWRLPSSAAKKCLSITWRHAAHPRISGNRQRTARTYEYYFE